MDLSTKGTEPESNLPSPHPNENSTFEQQEG